MANSFFVFLHKNALLEHAYSLVIDKNGTLTEPCKVRTLSELQTLNKQYSLTVVIPCNIVNAQTITLPTLKNYPLMLPNVLEETLLTPIEDIHFVLDKTPIADKTYLAYYVCKHFLDELLSTLKNAMLTASCITTDLLPKQTNTALITDEYIQLIAAPNYGALNKQALSLPDIKDKSSIQVFRFKNSNEALCENSGFNSPKLINCHYQSYVAQQQINTPGINLLQGAYQTKHKTNTVKKLLSMTFCMVSLFVFMVTNAWQYQRLNKTVKQLQADNFKHYLVIFPNAKQMVSPRFRVEQWLKQHVNDQTSPFLSILSTLSPILSKQHTFKLLSLNAQNKQLTLTFQMSDFNDLTILRQTIEGKGINITQVKALTSHNKINAIWRLSL